jgi:hypothetical protein
MVDPERQIGVRRLTDRLAVVDRLDQRQQAQLLLQPVGDLVQDARAFGNRGAAPGILGRVRGVEREFDILGGRAGMDADRLAGDRRGIVEVCPRTGATQRPPIQLS